MYTIYCTIFLIVLFITSINFTLKRFHLFDESYLRLANNVTQETTRQGFETFSDNSVFIIGRKNK